MSAQPAPRVPRDFKPQHYGSVVWRGRWRFDSTLHEPNRNGGSSWLRRPNVSLRGGR